MQNGGKFFNIDPKIHARIIGQSFIKTQTPERTGPSPAGFDLRRRMQSPLYAASLEGDDGILIKRLEKTF
jgi:hypothetical protein